MFEFRVENARPGGDWIGVNVLGTVASHSPPNLAIGALLSWTIGRVIGRPLVQFRVLAANSAEWKHGSSTPCAAFQVAACPALPSTQPKASQAEAANQPASCRAQIYKYKYKKKYKYKYKYKARQRQPTDRHHAEHGWFDKDKLSGLPL